MRALCTQEYRVSEDRQVDGQCIFIEKDAEKDEYIDYTFTCEVWGKDPRFKQRRMIIGQAKGLFRIDKSDQSPSLLLPMEGDSSERRYKSAASKVLKKHRSDNVYPEKAAFQSG